MVPVKYISEKAYLHSCTTVAAKIVAIDAIIDALYDQMLTLAQNESPIQEYILYDGQTKIECKYTTSKSITDTISALTLRRNKLANEGRRVTRGMDIKNFIGRRY